MRVTPIAWTHFDANAVKDLEIPWETDAEGGEALAEFAGRACYQSWHKPNPATATNQGYLRHILEVKHFSVLEHSTVTFYITGISRSLTHELIRHRHLSYSQLSQRFVNQGTDMVEPGIIKNDPKLHQRFVAATTDVMQAYRYLVRALDVEILHNPAISSTQRRKLSRQAARSLLPNAAETKIVITGNYRAWLEFIAKRNSPEADVEICELAQEIQDQLKRIAPNVFDNEEPDLY